MVVLSMPIMYHYFISSFNSTDTMPPRLISFPPDIVKASYVQYVEISVRVFWHDPIAMDNYGHSGLDYRKGTKPVTDLHNIYLIKTLVT